MIDEISFKYRGNPSEIFKITFSKLINVIMKDIKKEIIDNNGCIFINYSDNDIELQAASNNPAITMKMTIKLQGIDLNKIKLN